MTKAGIALLITWFVFGIVIALLTGFWYGRQFERKNSPNQIKPGNNIIQPGDQPGGEQDNSQMPPGQIQQPNQQPTSPKP